MAGRGDKGLLITTGTFKAEAKAGANRPGAQPIGLIDGYQLGKPEVPEEDFEKLAATLARRAARSR